MAKTTVSWQRVAVRNVARREKPPLGRIKPPSASPAAVQPPNRFTQDDVLAAYRQGSVDGKQEGYADGLADDAERLRLLAENGKLRAEITRLNTELMKARCAPILKKLDAATKV